MVAAAWSAAVNDAEAMVQVTETESSGSPYHPFNPMRVAFVMEADSTYLKAFPELKNKGYLNLCLVIRRLDDGTVTKTPIDSSKVKGNWWGAGLDQRK